MAKLFTGKEKQKKVFWKSFYLGVRKFMDFIICFYMLLMIVGLPFYNEEGYTHVGTDKAMFFRFWSKGCVYFMIPVAAIYVVTYFLQKAEARKQEEIYWKNRNKKKKEENKVQTNKILTNKIFTSIKSNLSLTDIGAILFGFSSLISFWLTRYPQEALMGTVYWYMGLYTQLVLVGSYFLISRIWTKRLWMIALFLPVSGIVFLLGFLNRFGIYPIEMINATPQFISTIGNINWYCAYLVTVLFGGVFLFWYSGDGMKWVKISLTVYVGIGFATLVTHGSSSGLLALIVAMVVLFCFSAMDKSGVRMMRFWMLALLLSGICFLVLSIRFLFPGKITYIESTVELMTLSSLPLVMVIVSGIFVLLTWGTRRVGVYPAKMFRVFMVIVLIVCGVGVVGFAALLVINTLHPGSIGILSNYAAFTFSPDWGSKRGATWQAGVKLFGEQDFWHKVFGVGPDAFAAALTQEGDTQLVEMVNRVFGGNRLTNAHNEWLTVLVNEGIIGCVGYVLMIVSAIYRYLRRGFQGEAKDQRACLAGACGLGILAYVVNSMVSFQQTMGAVILFLVLGIGEAYAGKHSKDRES
jgi:hypothetical protein